MDDILYAGNRVLFLILALSALPIAVATIIGLAVGMIQTITQLQEQTLPFGLKLLGVIICLFLISGWYGDILLGFAKEVIVLAMKR